MKLIAVCCYYMLAPFLVFYTMAAFDDSRWQDFYYLWDKSKDVLVFYCLYKLSYRWLKVLPLVAGIFALIRLLWHIITVTFGLLINDPPIVNILFAILVAACVFLMTRQLLKKWPKAEK